MSTLQAVQGKNVTIRVKSDIDGLYYPYACATNADITYTVELILKTSPGDGRAKKYRPRSTDGTVSLEGVTTILPVGMWSVFDLLEKSIRGDYMDLQMEFINNAGDVKTLACTVLASEIDLSASADGLSQFTINFQMTGASDVFAIPVPGDGTTGGGGDPGGGGGTGGSTSAGVVSAGRYAGDTISWTDAATIGKTLLMAFRQVPMQIITSGTPAPHQIKFDSLSGTFTLNSVLDAGPPHEAAYYLYK